jgi:hypothetical protein
VRAVISRHTRKRKSRATSPSGSRAAHSADSGEDAEETTGGKRLTLGGRTASATSHAMMPPPPPSVKRRRRRKLSAVVAALSATASNPSDSGEEEDDSCAGNDETDPLTLASVLSVEESVESASTVSVPAPAAPRLRSRVRRSQPSAGSEERAPTILDSAEDAEGEDTDALSVVDAAVAVRHRPVRVQRRPQSAALASTQSLAKAFAFALPDDVTRQRRRVRIAAAAFDDDARLPANGRRAAAVTMDRKGVVSEDAAAVHGDSSGHARQSSGDNDAESGAAAASTVGRGGTASVVDVIDADDSDEYDRDERDDVIARLRLRSRSHADDSKGDEDDDAIEAFEEHQAAENK